MYTMQPGILKAFKKCLTLLRKEQNRADNVAES